MKIRIINETTFIRNYNGIDYIEVDEKILDEIGITKQFDKENNCVIDFDNTEFLETKRLNQLREKRKLLLEAFDKWEKAVLRGRELESDTIMQWYQDILDLKESAFDEANIPERIKYYSLEQQYNMQVK